MIVCFTCWHLFGVLGTSGTLGAPGTPFFNILDTFWDPFSTNFHFFGPFSGAFSQTSGEHIQKNAIAPPSSKVLRPYIFRQSTGLRVLRSACARHCGERYEQASKQELAVRYWGHQG